MLLTSLVVDVPLVGTRAISLEMVVRARSAVKAHGTRIRAQIRDRRASWRACELIMMGVGGVRVSG